jgi:hypothetical protein
MPEYNLYGEDESKPLSLTFCEKGRLATWYEIICLTSKPNRSIRLLSLYMVRKVFLRFIS